MISYVSMRGFSRTEPGLGVFETGEGVLQSSLFGQRHQKGQRGLRALILAKAIHMQAVAASARAGVVKRQAQIISTEEPLESTARFRNPENIARGVIRFNAG